MRWIRVPGFDEGHEDSSAFGSDIGLLDLRLTSSHCAKDTTIQRFWLIAYQRAINEDD